MKKTTWVKVKRYRGIYLMLLPVLVYFLVFSYYPLILGFINSFHKVKLLGGSQFVGLENYQAVARSSSYQQALGNSLILGIGTFLLQFVWGLAIAVLLNEVKNKVVKSFVQTVTYIPYLLSWAVVGGLWITLFSPTGMINGILEMIQGADYRPIVFMAEPAFARGILIFTGAWKGAGYFAALFLAAIVSLDESLYESAQIDGATRWQQITKITLPQIIPTMKIVTVLSAMSVIRNFDQVFIMGNASINEKVQSLLVLIYQDGILKFDVGTATAAATLVLVITMIISFVVRKLLHYDQAYD
ncbi:MAG: sugar ABC transporter permease [Clostridiales bacterium]|nr:sugar ABC transporter permease [Clostridiales bacterium]